MWWEERAGWVRSLGKWFESGRLLEPASVEILGGFSDSPWSQTLLAEINRLLIVQEASRIWGEDSWKWYPVAVECFSLGFCNFHLTTHYYTYNAVHALCVLYITDWGKL